MRTRTYFVSVLLLLLLALAANGQSERSALRGVPPVTSVVIEGLNSDAVSGGLSKDQLKTDVELRLRKAGLRISDDATSFLYVRVTDIKTSPCDGFAVHATVEFNRPATLEIGNGATSLKAVAVWSQGKLFTSTPSSFARSTRESIGDLVDRFLNDYLAANPKT